MLEPDTAGDPITGIKWTRKTTHKISQELAQAGITVSHTTVARLLKELNYRLRVNRKQLAGTNHPQRNEQFEHIHSQRQLCEQKGIPVISVDSKKRELVGCFKNNGAVWAQSPQPVNDHDFRSQAIGMAISYGIYDMPANCGGVFVGTSHDTPAFAATAIARWWSTQGRARYPNASRLFILADNGGSNGSRCRAWRYELQHQLVNPFGLTVTVSHYPPGTSKWNPIEHRLFAEISKNWAGQPLVSYETILNCIATTKTLTGLTVSAALLDGNYATGVKITERQMAELNLQTHDVCPMWNYTIRPQHEKCEVVS